MATTTPKATTPASTSTTPKRKAPAKSRVPANETAAGRFTRVATPRLQKAVKSLRQLSNVAKGAGYDFTTEQANTIMRHIDAAVESLRKDLVQRVNGTKPEESIRL